jgi:Transposase DDE domain group 1
MGQSTSLVRPRSVSGDGEGLVSRAGLIWLGETAELCGLTAGLSAAMARLARRRVDPGRSLAQVVLGLADGATCLSDLAVLRDQPRLFGQVGSQTTIWRTFAQMGTAEFAGLDTARAQARRRAWAAGAGPAAGRPRHHLHRLPGRARPARRGPRNARRCRRMARSPPRRPRRSTRREPGQTVTTLEQSGIIERRGDPTDKRVALVALTTAGANYLKTRRRLGTKAFIELLDQLPDDETATLLAASPALEHLLTLDDEQRDPTPPTRPAT